jgi:hypothetical protein
LKKERNVPATVEKIREFMDRIEGMTPGKAGRDFWRGARSDKETPSASFDENNGLEIKIGPHKIRLYQHGCDFFLVWTTKPTRFEGGIIKMSHQAAARRLYEEARNIFAPAIEAETAASAP